jgi:uncharacterized protein with HEPN domain
VSRDWRDFLADVAAHAAIAADIAARHEPTDLDGDPVIRLALERALEIVGEAASKVPTEVQARYPDIPWRAMIGARHRLVHGYFALDRALLWRTAREVIPATLPRLREIVRLEGADRPPTEDTP